ncbi:autotransporter domain-containing protein [Lysobacter sp. A6]|uniref:Autotransporter domain-containing protein n=1 Tax=Noviluteimonas lactosilytica TaxID=2888523 RepID=A0ABS8JFU4_9GAMM|nr:autotransporter domain-containing protein [Lysobacter lactosilyticus]MCC8362370.1 autotransporter domain-containing protein [Lysobacter lactosilyticus]
MKQTHRAFRPIRTVLAAALAFAALPAAAQTYTQTVFFGDSLTDSGWFRPALVQVAGPQAAILGRFSTNPTQVWSEYLANYYGTNATSGNQGGTNWAVGGANTGIDSAGALGEIPSINTQIQRYLTATGGRADANALYTVWGGANDLFAIAGGAPAQERLALAVGAQVGNVATLTGAGARYILVPTVPDIGLTPSALAQGPIAMATGTQLATAYNNALFSTLASQGLRVIPLDTFHLIQEIVASPSAYGFSNVTGTACQPQITASSLTCSPANYVTPDAASTYLFADGVHPTGATHQMLGQYALSVLEAPRQIAMLPYTEQVIGKSRAEMVSSHIVEKPAEDGMRWWFNLRGDNQRYDVPGDYDGGGPSMLFGVDWASGEFVYGAFAGYGRNDFDYGRRRGDFDQDDATLGGFVGWYTDDLWVNAQLSWTSVSYDVNRLVELGPAVREYRGSPDGENWTVGAQGGWNFHAGSVTHGPVVSLLAQRIDVDAFAEDRVDSAGLAYPDQNYDSLIGAAGWQASFDVSPTTTPYARLTWEHEFEDMPEEAFAQSLSIPGTLPFAVPNLERDDNYGTLAFGIRTQMWGMDADVGANASVGQEGGNHATVFVNVGKRF